MRGRRWDRLMQLIQQHLDDRNVRHAAQSPDQKSASGYPTMVQKQLTAGRPSGWPATLALTSRHWRRTATPPDIPVLADISVRAHVVDIDGNGNLRHSSSWRASGRGLQ
jgi:hypothetical protein